MKDSYIKRNLWTKALILWIVILFILSCGGSKDYDEIPMPVGGDSRVQAVIQQVFGSAYLDMVGSNVRFSIEINEEGEIEHISGMVSGLNRYNNDVLLTAMKDHIKFTPATKNGKRVKAKFNYHFYF